MLRASAWKVNATCTGISSGALPNGQYPEKLSARLQVEPGCEAEANSTSHMLHVDTPIKAVMTADALGTQCANFAALKMAPVSVQFTAQGLDASQKAVQLHTVTASGVPASCSMNHGTGVEETAPPSATRKCMRTAQSALTQSA